MDGGRVPVLTCYVEGLWFALIQILQTVRVSWLPLVLAGGAYWSFVILADDVASGGFRTPYDGLKLVALMFLPISLIILRAMQTIGLYRVYFGEANGWWPFYFRFRSEELRMFFSILVLMILVGLIALFSVSTVAGGIYGLIQAGLVPAGVVDEVVQSARDNETPLSPHAIQILYVTAGLFALLTTVFVARVSILGAVITNENVLGPGRSWRLTRHNTIRMIVLLVLLIATAVAIGSAALYFGWQSVGAVAPRPDDLPFLKDPLFLYGFWPLHVAGIVTIIFAGSVVAGATARAYDAVA